MGGKGKGKSRKGAGKGKRVVRRLGAPRGPPRRGTARLLRAPTTTRSSSQFLQPLPDDPVAPFLHPAARSLVQVPLEFSTLRQWCDVIGNNILAEFWHVYKEASPAFSGFGGAAGDELIIDNAPADGLTQHLLLVSRQPCLVTSQRVLAVGKVALKLRGGQPRSGPVKSLGYVGSYLAEFAAMLELRRLPPGELTGPMRAILEPKADQPGDYARRPLDVAAVPINPSQRSAVEGLRRALEKIQGPPGTGKSTTIFHILDARVPAGQRVLVTCSRNVAVESIAQKLAGLDGWPLCVFGPRDRVGETARRHLLDCQVGGHFDERKLQRIAPMVSQHGSALREAIARREGACAGRRGERFLLAFLRHRYTAVYAFRELCDRLESYCAAATVQPDWCKERLQASKGQVLGGARVFLCTIASTSRLLREWEEAMGDELNVHTVIVDECGCTPESSTALLLRLRPSNLVLVGDHKQLPPVSLVPPQVLEGTGHTRSLLERCVLASGHVHQLREQYRMHPSLATLVSKLFYAGRLQTPPEVSKKRCARESRPLVWLDVQGHETAPERSYVNTAEVSSATRACARMRELAGPGPTIALLTFYRGQLQALMQAVPSDLDVEVLTVDACQGSEFDYVVLSTVRANRDQRLGFVKDQQRICVAISRARLKLLIVGSRFTLSGDNDWREVAATSQPAQPHEIAPQQTLPAAGSFVSVYDELRRQKQLEAEQKANAAMEEEQRGRPSAVSAVSLMRQQASFRDKQARRSVYAGHDQGRATLQRRNDGTYQGRGFVAIGGGFRRRADVAELEAAAAQHQAMLDSACSGHGRSHAPYRATRSPEEYETKFPTLDTSVAESAVEHAPPRLLAFRGRELRPATKNDERRARRAAQRATTGPVEQPTAETQDSVALPELPDETEWMDVSEAMLFEMFPDDVEAVEETLLRFAGMAHAPARALEALLARPSATAGKRILDGEDDLDYDIALLESKCDADGEGTTETEAWENCEDDGLREEETQEDDGEHGYEIEWGQCASCGKEAEGGASDCGDFYCYGCWAEWHAHERPSVPPVPEKQRADGGTGPGPCARAEGESASASELSRKTRASRQPARPTERNALFFGALDGAPRWAEAPARPEAGGKELVALKPKGERDEDAASREALGARRWARSANAVTSIPAAALPKPASAPTEAMPDRCRRLLREVAPPVEESAIDYIVSLVEEDTSDDTRDIAIEILEGHGVIQDVARRFWNSLLAL